MDILQIALIFLILLLSIFLAITGFQVFLILKNLKKALDRLNQVLDTTQEIAQEVEKPVAAAANLITAIQTGAKVVQHAANNKKPAAATKPSGRRFFKKL